MLVVVVGMLGGRIWGWGIMFIMSCAVGVDKVGLWCFFGDAKVLRLDVGDISHVCFVLKVVMLMLIVGLEC